MVIRWLRQDFAAALARPFTLRSETADLSAGFQDVD
jgi:hypothetical protein